MIEEEPALLPLLYEYPYDFTKYASVFSSQEVGKEPTQEVAAALAVMTGDPWTLEPKREFTLYKARVSCLGSNLPAYPTSKRFKKALCITLSVRYNSRSLYLVYNEQS